MLTRRHFLLVSLAGLTAALVPTTFAPVMVKPAGPVPSIADTWDAAGTLRKGDIFTIEGRYLFDPVARRPTRVLQRFVITGEVSSTTLNIRPL